MSLSNCFNYFLKHSVFRNSGNPEPRSQPGVSGEIDPAGAVIGLESEPVEVHVDNHPSILDIDIPDSAKVNDDVEVTETQNMKRQESFLTEVEEFTQTSSVETELETQLRPVFDLCQPNSEGLISIEHLRAMCREHGQVGSLSLHSVIVSPRYFQDADAVVGKIDPVGRGLVSFSTFCQGVATMMEANLDTGGPRNVTDGEIIFLLNIPVPHLAPVGWKEEFSQCFSPGDC